MPNYPLSNYHFIVEWGGRSTGFTEVTGLSLEVEVIEYREGNQGDNRNTKMPGLWRFSNIILKRGIVEGDTDFYKWLSTIKHNAVERRDVMISLLNESHAPVRVWKARGAWPCKIQAPDLKACGNEVAIETIELAHEGLEIVE